MHTSQLPLALLVRCSERRDAATGGNSALRLYGEMVNDHKHFFEVIPSGKFWAFGPKNQIKEVRKHTYFLAGLKPANLGLLEARISAAPHAKSFWSDLTDNHDAIMFSVCIALGGQEVPWDLIRRIRVSLVSNLIQNRDTFLLKRKAYLAKKRKYILTGLNDPVLPRNLSWMQEIFDRIRDPPNSKGYIERYMTLLNKRSCGVPRDRKVIEQKLVEYFHSVQQPARDDRPVISKEIIAATLRVSDHFHGRNLGAAATVLLTTTACFEASEKQGGKLSLVREIAQSDELIEMFDLETGEKSGRIATRLADKILHKSLQKFSEGYEDFFSVRICALPELGMKVRIPSCGSFYRTQVLQPISKIFLEALKGVPELQAGLQLERQGWEVYKTFIPGEFQRRLDHQVLCSDYTSSTDWIKRSVAEKAYNALANIVGLPKWYKEVGLKAYLHDLVHVPRVRAGIASKAKGHCVSVLDKENRITSGVAMGDPITKAMLSFISLMVGMKYTKHPSATGTKTFMVGDDFVAIGPNGDLTRFRRTAETFGFVVSEDDTFISRHWAHFTEFCFRIPRNRWEDYSLCRVIRHHPCYADSIRPRIVMRVGKSGSNETDPRVGRLKLLAQEMSYIPDNHVSGTLFQIATLWQDANFGIKSAIAYLPHFFGGAGKIAPPGYLDSLRNDKAAALIRVAADYLSFPKETRVYHPARNFLRERVHMNTQLYNSHMREEKTVNLTEIINMIERRKDFSAFAVITAAEQARIGVNLSRVLTHENHYVVTSEKLAERLYIFSSLMKEVYGVDVLNAPVLSSEPIIPDEVWDLPQKWGVHPNYRELAEEFVPTRTIYLKEVMGLLDTSQVTHPQIPLRVDVLAESEIVEEVDLMEFAKYVRELKGHTDNVRAWMNIPRKVIDADSIIKHIARLIFEMTGEVPSIATDDRALLRETGSKRVEGVRVEADEATAVAIREWGKDLDDPERRSKALMLLASRVEDGPLFSAKQVLVDPANVEASRVGRFAQRPLKIEDRRLVERYLKGNFPPFVEDLPWTMSPEQFKELTFSKLRKLVGGV